MITEDYVSFETAKLLKEKGFDSEEVGCHGGFYSEERYASGYGVKTNSGQEVGIVYDDLRNCDLFYDEYLRPTLQMAMKWLREVHNITIGITFRKPRRILWEIYKNEDFICGGDSPLSYEDVCEDAIKLCLENLI